MVRAASSRPRASTSSPVNNRRLSSLPAPSLQRGTVEVRLRKMRNRHQRDAVLRRKLLRQARSLLSPAKLGELAKALQRHRSWAIHHQRLLIIGITQHFPAPRRQLPSHCRSPVLHQKQPRTRALVAAGPPHRQQAPIARDVERHHHDAWRLLAFDQELHRWAGRGQ